jgi:hypothetical protein
MAVGDGGISLGNAASGFTDSLSNMGVNFQDSPVTGSANSSGNFFSNIGSTLSDVTGLSNNNFLGSGTNSLLGGFGSLFGGSGFKTNATSSGSSSSWISDLFLRAVVIILGFIFVAVGLSMFGSKTAVNVVGKVAGK